MITLTFDTFGCACEDYIFVFEVNCKNIQKCVLNVTVLEQSK